MEILRTSAHYGRTQYIVRLERSELAMTEQQLVNVADGGGNPANYDRCHNFGGRVELRTGKRSLHTYARIDVYID